MIFNWRLKLYNFLKKGDVLLGDRAFCAYADLVLIKSLDCDAVFRKHQSRKTSMRSFHLPDSDLNREVLKHQADFREK